MEPNSEVCSKCGKPKSGTGGATITQWIAVCRCEALAFEAAAAQAEQEGYEICLTCGKRVEEKRAGSLTQWIFKENSCRCEFPEIISSEEYHASAQAPVPGVRRTADAPDDSKIRVELGALLDEDLKPRTINKTPASLISALIIGGVLAVVSLFAVFVAMTPSQQKVDSMASKFDSPVEFEMAEREPAASVGAVGIKVDGTKVTEVQRFMPAENAGIRVADVIEKIDGNSVAGKSTDEVQQLLLGSYATPVTMSILRNGKPIEMTMARSEDIYEDLNPKLSAKDYYQLAVDDKFRGKANKSRLEFTLAAEIGDDSIKQKAKQQMLAELPRDYVHPEAEDLNNSAHNLLCSGAYKTALVKLKDAIDRYPSFEWPYLNLALFYHAKKTDDKPEPLLKKLIEINPNMSRAWIAMSLVKERQGDQAEAERCMKTAQGLNEDAAKDKRTMVDILELEAEMYQNTDKRLGINRHRRR